MNKIWRIACAATLGIANLLLSGGSVMAATTPQPNPPAQLCANDKCVTTIIAPPASSGGPYRIKWNPGHYMASFGVVYGNTNANFVNSEIDDLNNRDAILGYRMMISWAALEPTKGNYDFSAIDATLARLKSHYNQPKRLVLMLWWYSMHAMNNNDNSVIPLYIQTNPIYGQSPVSGSYGWWGRSSNGVSNGMYAPALYNAAVMDRFIALIQALGNHLDGEPNFEALFTAENSAIVQSAFSSPADPTYNDANWLAQQERMLTAATTAFPHTTIIMCNGFFQNGANAVALEQWMANNRIAAGTSDTLGQTALTQFGWAPISDGLRGYLGVDPKNGADVDLRPKMPAMFDVELGELYGTYFHKYNGPWPPSDLVDALNQTYQATHAFWTRLTQSQVEAPMQWKNLADYISTHPLVRTAYPANYPQ